MKKSLKFAILIFVSFTIVLTILSYLYFKKPNQYLLVQSKENSKITENIKEDFPNQLTDKTLEDQNLPESHLKEEKSKNIEGNFSDILSQEHLGNTKSASPSILPSSSSITTLKPASTPSQNPPIVTPAEKESATVKIAQVGSFQVELKDQDTALTILQRAGKENGFEIEYQWYDGLGAFINCLAGICSRNNYYWVFYYNGRYSLVGASSQSVMAGDIINWQFEKM